MLKVIFTIDCSWHEVEQESGLQLVYKTGLLYIFQDNKAEPKLFYNYRDALVEMGAR